MFSIFLWIGKKLIKKIKSTCLNILNQVIMFAKLKNVKEVQVMKINQNKKVEAEVKIHLVVSEKII